MPLGLDHPYWVDDPGFDLDFHVRELALPEPGDERMLAEQVGRLVSRPLDRAHPLWELYLIHGLENGHVAVLTKFHHAAIDGASGAEILGILLDLDPAGEAVAPRMHGVGGERLPSQWRMLAKGLGGMPRQPLRAVRSLPQALPHLDQNPMLRHIPGVEALAGASRRALRARPRSKDGGVLEGRSLARSADDRQPPDLTAPAARLLEPVARRDQADQEPLRGHRQRRRRHDLRRRHARVARSGSTSCRTRRWWR